MLLLEIFWKKINIWMKKILNITNEEKKIIILLMREINIKK